MSKRLLQEMNKDTVFTLFSSRNQDLHLPLKSIQIVVNQLFAAV